MKIESTNGTNGIYRSKPTRGYPSNAWGDVDITRLARKVGLSVTSLSHYLNGRREFRLPMAQKVAMLLGITVEKLSERIRTAKQKASRQAKRRAA